MSRESDAAGLAAEFRSFAETTGSRAPLYSRLSAGIADSAIIPALFRDAPGPARVPVNLFAAVHYLVLGEPGSPLAAFYPNLTDFRAAGDPLPVFLEFVDANADRIRVLLATRIPQTNEIGRSALFLAGFGQLEDGIGPLAHLDVGASAGLNLMIDRLAYDDGLGNLLGSSALVLECGVRGRRPNTDPLLPHQLAGELPTVSARLGLDANPVDVHDSDQARWLEACVWPDQADRFGRLKRAIELAEANPVPVQRGDAVDDLPAALDRIAGHGHPVVTTSWALCYLPPDRQQAFLAGLGDLARGSDLSWLWAEAPDRVGLLPVPQELAGSDQTVLGLSRWRGGVRTDRVLAICHPHGYWLGWL